MFAFAKGFLFGCLCYVDSRSFWLSPGWRFGAVYGKSGAFPSEYVHPVAAPDFLVLPPDRVEPRDRHGQVAASAAIAVAMGSSVAAHELDLSTEVKLQKHFFGIHVKQRNYQ